VVITCGEEEKTESIELTGTGLLTLDKTCRGYASHTMLHPVTIVHNLYLKDIIHETKLTRVGEIKDPGTIKINFKQLGKIEKLHDLRAVSNTLEDINTDIDNQLAQQSMSRLYNHNNYMSYLIGGRYSYCFYFFLYKLSM